MEKVQELYQTRRPASGTEAELDYTSNSHTKLSY